MTRYKSDIGPLEAEVARAAAETIRKAQAIGLVDGTPRLHDLSYADVKAAVLQVRRAGVGTRAADDFIRSDPSDTVALARDLRELQTLLEESPLPATEWPRLLSVFDRDQLARLLGTSPSSVNRYERGERETPDEVAARLHFLALVVGDLLGAYNEIGVRRWFERKRTALDGRAPAQLLAGAWRPEDKGPQRVRALARALVSSPGT